MIIKKGEKLHVIYRAIYENSTRRHFIGKVTAAEGAVCRVEGFVFVYDQKTTEFIRKTDKRITIINTSESGYITNIIDPNTKLEDVIYTYTKEMGLIATDNESFSLSINEFGLKS